MQPQRMAADPSSFSTLERLATSASVRDRAFAASALGMRRGDPPEQVAKLYRRIDETAQRQHAALRARIRDGNLDREAFVAMLEAEAPDVRDHLIEEILGIAYPPLDERKRPPDATLDNPSGLSEILFALRQARLGPDDTFVDLGAGPGKVVLLVALLSGARALGIELNGRLVARAEAASAALGLEKAGFVEGDIRSATLPEADVYYMFIPFLGSAEVVARLAPLAARRKVRLFCQTLDLKVLPWLRPTGARSYWLEMYESV
jgi:SAM-dependent methyltransferase